MRSFLSLFACLMLVVSAWGGIAQASGFACSETAGQVAVYVAGDCDEGPADADKNAPHCHTGCHGHYIAVPIPSRAARTASSTARSYAPVAEPKLTAHQIDRTLRPPQA